jgi:hypothetical protein
MVMRRSLLVNSLLVFTLVGCTHVSPSSSPDTTPPTDTSSPSEQSESLHYPQLYLDANLPQYPDATLTDTGRQTKSLKDGIKLTLQTHDSVTTAAAFFRSQLESLSWQLPKEPFPQENLYVAEFQKDDLTFLITITRFEGQDHTQISINYLQN